MGNRVVCPTCRIEFSVPGELKVGQKLQCPECRKTFSVRAPQSEPEYSYKPAVAEAPRPVRKVSPVAIGFGIVVLMLIAAAILLPMGFFPAKPEPVPPKETGTQSGTPTVAETSTAERSAPTKLAPGPTSTAKSAQDINVPIVWQPTRSVVAHTKRIPSLDVSDDGQWLASCDWSGRARVWNRETLKQVHDFNSGSQTLNVVVFSPDSRTVAGAGYAKFAMLWDLENPNPRRLDCPWGDVYRLWFSPDGRTLTSGSNTRMCVWDTSNGGMMTLQEKVPFEFFVPAPGLPGSPLVLASGFGDIGLWSGEEGPAAFSKRKVASKGVQFLCGTRDGKRIAIASGSGPVVLWNSESLKIEGKFPGQRELFRRLAFDSKGEWLAAVTGDIYGANRTSSFDEAQIWNCSTHTLAAVFRGPVDSMVSVAVGPGGRAIYTGGVDGSIRVWEVPVPGSGGIPTIVPPEVTKKALAMIARVGKSAIQNNNEIISVSLNRTKLTDADLTVLADLVFLKSLNLEQTSLNDTALLRFQNLKRLEKLWIRETSVTEAKVRELKTALPNCRIVWSQDDLLNGLLNHPGDIGLAAKSFGAHVGYKDSGEVDELGFSQPPFKLTDAGLDALKSFKSLRNLSLSAPHKGERREITDAGVAKLKEMTQLESLSLSNTKITDAGLAHLTGLTNLKSLILVNNEITDAGVGQLGELKKLKYLDFSRTKVTPDAMAKLRKLLPKCVIQPEPQ